MKRFLATVFFLLAFLPSTLWAQQGLIIIRDTEIENALRSWSVPIWQAAGLNPDAVKLVLVQSSDLNAFVAGGANIFIYTGLINAAKNPSELLGVIAHETGHIAGGHLIRGKQAMEHASYEAILATILGIGAAAVSGDAGAAGAIIKGGQGLALSNLLSHSRVQESSADQAALSYLEKAGFNPSGLASFLGTLKNQELLPASQQSAYLRTHPLTTDRIAAMETGVQKSAYANAAIPADMQDTFLRIQAKLAGFIEPQRVAWIYADKDTSIPALYAKAIAAYRQSKTTEALKLVDQLIAREGNNPWFHEIKGQMLRDFGRIEEAVSAYRQAITLAPDAALIRIDLAQLLIQMPNPQYAEAEKNLDMAYRSEKRSTTIQHLYATLYGRQGDEARARYHLAEEATLRGNTDEALRLLASAMAGIKPNSPIFRKAQDLKVYLDAQPKKGDRKKR